MDFDHPLAVYITMMPTLHVQLQTRVMDGQRCNSPVTAPRMNNGTLLSFVCKSECRRPRPGRLSAIGRDKRLYRTDSLTTAIVGGRPIGIGGL